MQPFYAPYPRGMIPGPMIPPGHMIVPRIPIMHSYGPYRPPFYNSGIVRQRGPRPHIKPSTITSGKDKDDESGDNRVVITEISSQDSGKNEENVQSENAKDSENKNGKQGKEDREVKD